MHLITYKYMGEIRNSVVAPFTNSGLRNYRVTIDSHKWFTIAPQIYPQITGSILWAQLIRLHEDSQPNELIQAIGQGIEDAGIV